ncbi:putative E3 ubiquitin-protein ligase dbl4 [Blattamonas nauphoetae]|uniref:RBR-type E3 ubiquitin transferase n=1 Tax=Blattamonas nauphoetae TaxID=2049346 RepID=A0ABQ9X8I0_9EUKA|nr:putative E3 ubiquitin-protein ligase dbl4 [Blattamonas nauphoetae]
MSSSECEEEYEEEYEEVSDDGSEGESILDDQALEIAPLLNDFEFINIHDILPRVNRIIDENCSILNRSRDDLIRALMHKNWFQDTVCNGFIEQKSKFEIECGISVKKKAKRIKYPFECPICYCPIKESDACVLPCGHAFCKDCIAMHCTACLSVVHPSGIIRCPQEGCLFVLPESVISSSNENRAKFEKTMTQRYIAQQKTLQFCPAPHCNWVLKKVGLKSTASCLCGRKFCFYCGEDPHEPCPCKFVEKWNADQKTDSTFNYWITAYTKKCPKCNKSIEKNGGCNHMTCSMCHHEFCWICMGPWSEHGSSTGGYYSCNRPKKNSGEDAAATAMERLKYAEHYLERFQAQAQSEKFTREEISKLDPKMEEYKKFVNCTIEQAQFIAEAVELLLECRVVLKNTYIVGYYMKKGAKKDLFEFMQQDLEGSTERLSELTERTVDQIERQETVNYTTHTRQFLNNLLEGMRENVTDLRTDL